MAILQRAAVITKGVPAMILSLVAALTLLPSLAFDSTTQTAADENCVAGFTSEWRRVADIPADSRESFDAQRDQAIATVEQQKNDLASLIPAFLTVKDDLHPKLLEYLIEVLKSKLSIAGGDGIAILRKFIDSEDPLQRKYGVVTLATLFFSTDGAKEAFVEIFYGDDVAISMAALEAVAGLAAIDSEAAFDMFENAVAGGRAQDRNRAKFVAKRRAQLLYMIEWADQRDPTVRSRVEVLGFSLGLDVQDQVSVHTELLTQHSEEGVRAQAASALGLVTANVDRRLFGVDGILRTLDSAYENDPSALVKVMVANSLVEFGDELHRQGDRLRAHLENPNRGVRFNAALGICKIGPTHVDVATVVDAVCELGRLYREIKEDSAERRFATQALSVLHAATNSEVGEIRVAAKEAPAGGCKPGGAETEKP